MQEYIYGKHAVYEALEKKPACVSHIYARADYSDETAFTALTKGKKVDSFDIQALQKHIPRDAVHQNIAAIIDVSKLLVPFKDWKRDHKADTHTSVVILGEIQDPQNVGAIIRSAAAFGVSAVLVPEHRNAPINGTVIKVSVGTAFSVPLVSVTNVNDALRTLKDMGYWVYGLDMHGDTQLQNEQFSKPSAFVVGNEGAGLREKTREVCDTILEIPMSDKAESLNAATSTAITLYAWKIQHLAP